MAIRSCTETMRPSTGTELPGNCWSIVPEVSDIGRTSASCRNPFNNESIRIRPAPLNSQQPALIEFKNITVMRGRTIAVDRVSLTIGVGEHVAILGPNGCGKSTLIKAITRECYPVYEEHSTVRIFGHEVWNVVELRSMLGIV